MYKTTGSDLLQAGDSCLEVDAPVDVLARELAGRKQLAEVGDGRQLVGSVEQMCGVVEQMCGVVEQQTYGVVDRQLVAVAFARLPLMAKVKMKLTLISP